VVGHYIGGRLSFESLASLCDEQSVVAAEEGGSSSSSASDKRRREMPKC
jgi:hypothetical protein